MPNGTRCTTLGHEASAIARHVQQNLELLATTARSDELKLSYTHLSSGQTSGTLGASRRC